MSTNKRSRLSRPSQSGGGENRHAMTVYLTREAKQALDLLAEGEGRTRAEVIRESLKLYSNIKRALKDPKMSLAVVDEDEVPCKTFVL